MFKLNPLVTIHNGYVFREHCRGKVDIYMYIRVTNTALSLHTHHLPPPQSVDAPVYVYKGLKFCLEKIMDFVKMHVNPEKI